MKTSSVITRNGNPCLCIGEEELSACAYITYFDERNDYAAFAENDFRIYSVSVSLAAQPINTASGFMPFKGGVFDVKGKTDFSLVDEVINKILQSCPNAYIFPRIYVCMPQWWIDENPQETVAVPNGKRREALYSEKFRTDSSEMLKLLIEHFKTFDASDHIFGYQISGGNTQEWFHLDLKGSYCENALPYFNKYLQEKYPDAAALENLPDVPGQIESVSIEDRLTTEYLRFASDSVAQTIEHLCREAKEAVDNKQIIGVFYGYTAEVADPLWGTHSLYKLLDSPNIDFFSSPNSYANQRALGIDWADMMPVDSIKLHGKMCFVECDIRTFLTRSPEESRAGSDPLHYYSNKVWEGPETEELSLWAVRKSLVRQLTHKHGLWWFDMFGHWFAAEKLMSEMKRSLELYNDTIRTKPYEYPIQVALILDETVYSRIGTNNPAYNSAYNIRKSLGCCGAPYSVYLASDFDRIDWKNSAYKAVVFGTPCESDFAADAADKLRSCDIACISVSEEKPEYSAEELTAFFKQSGVFIYCESSDVFYCGNGYMALHAVTEGEKHIEFPQTIRCTDVSDMNTRVSDHLHFTCKQFETKLFRIES